MQTSTHRFFFVPIVWDGVVVEEFPPIVVFFGFVFGVVGAFLVIR